MNANCRQMSGWSNMFLIISEEPGEWRHKTIFCWTGAWQNLSTGLSFHLHRLSRRQQTMTSMHVVPQSRTQVQCDSPAPRTEQLRAPAAFSLSPSGLIPKEDTYASWMALHPHSTLSFFVFFPPCFCLSSVFILFLCSKATPLLLQQPTSGQHATDRPLHRRFLFQHSQSCDAVFSKTCTFLCCVPVWWCQRWIG